MTQNTQTTAERIQALITAQYGQTVWRSPSNAATAAAAEIDRLTAERDEARAEVERLRISARALELLKGEGWTVADYVAQAEEESRARAAKVTP